MYGSFSAGFPHVVEPDCRADSRVWTDLLLWRSNPSKSLHGRYAWICGASSRPHPSRLLHLEYASSGGLSVQGTTWIPAVLTSCWEGRTIESHSGQAGSGAAGSNIAGSSTTGSSDGAPLCQPLPSSRGQPAAPQQQVAQPLNKSTGLGVTFDSSTNKPVATDGHGRQRTQG